MFSPMEPFEYFRAEDWERAVGAMSHDGAAALGGGTDLIPLARERLVVPSTVVDLRAIPQAREVAWGSDGTLRVGAAVTLREIANDQRIDESFPMFAAACAAVGSYALRNMGTLGGNLCQRVRCWYYRHGHDCLRSGGNTCSAMDGANQYHAIFRQGPCVAVHPSDPAVALCALDASIQITGPMGERTVPCVDFVAPSRARLDDSTVLGPGELVSAVTVPGASAGGVQFFEKVMQRGAWDFALVSLAAQRRRDGEVRLVLGGVANTPWRVTDSVEEDVASGGLSEDDIETLATRALYDAEPLAHNAYKIEIAAALLRRGVARLVAAPST